MKLWRYKDGRYAVKPLINGVHVHRYIRDEGVRWLERQGVREGDELPRGAYHTLDRKGWLYTKEEYPFGTPAKDIPARSAPVPSANSGCLGILLSGVQKQIEGVHRDAASVNDHPSSPANRQHSSSTSIGQGCVLSLIVSLVIACVVIWIGLR